MGLLLRRRAVELLVFSVTPFKIDQNKKSKTFYRLSLESENREKVDMQRLLPRFRSQQFFFWRYAEKRLPQIYRDLYGDAMLVPTYNLGQNKWNIRWTTPPPFQWYQNGAFLAPSRLHHCFGGGGGGEWGIIVPFYTVQDCRWAPTWRPETSRNICHWDPFQTPLHSCAEPNSIRFDFGVTFERRLIQTAYLHRT